MSGTTLPGAHLAVIADAKVRDYLLNAGHYDNQGKAGFFLAFGFSQASWQVLREALRRHPLANPVSGVRPSRFGMKYAVRCALISPDGRSPCIRSVWIVDASMPAPQFVTAYP